MAVRAGAALQFRWLKTQLQRYRSGRMFVQVLRHSSDRLLKKKRYRRQSIHLHKKNIAGPTEEIKNA